jgi:hypothetical protein
VNVPAQIDFVRSSRNPNNTTTNALTYIPSARLVAGSRRPLVRPLTVPRWGGPAAWIWATGQPCWSGFGQVVHGVAPNEAPNPTSFNNPGRGVTIGTYRRNLYGAFGSGGDTTLTGALYG